MALKSAASITSKMYESPLFSGMGVGATGRLFLIGHADGLTRNAPYQVSSMNEALDIMSRDQESSLVRGLLEAYYAGARDIWIVAAAPMSEYVPYLDRDGDSDQFYYDYKDRLIETYNVLKEWDIAQITVPLEAPFNSGADFLTPLANYCAEAFHISGEIHTGILGTRGVLTQEYIDLMANDPRLDQAHNGKYVSIFAGDGVFNFGEIGTSYNASIAAVTAAQFATLPMDRSLMGRAVRNAYSVVGTDLSKENISKLAEAGINTATRNSRGRRGTPYQVTYNSDNTLSPEGSDYWSLATMNLVMVVSSELRSMGKKRLGTIGYGLFKQDVENYLLGLTESDLIRDYSVSFSREPTTPNTVFVDLVIRPYFSVREIHVPIYVGAHQGVA